MTARRAVTLMELIVVLVLLGVIAGVVGLTVHTARRPVQMDPILAAVEAARDSAIRTGHTVTIMVHANGAEHEATAGPDGLVRADSALEIDLLTGAHNAAP